MDSIKNLRKYQNETLAFYRFCQSLTHKPQEALTYTDQLKYMLDGYWQQVCELSQKTTFDHLYHQATISKTIQPTPLSKALQQVKDSSHIKPSRKKSTKSKPKRKNKPLAKTKPKTKRKPKLQPNKKTHTIKP
jgi:hypothetical protein